MSGYCDAQEHGQPRCSVQCAQCIGEEGLDALRAENARLREALKRYGQHEAYCAFDPPLGVCDLCTCGLSAALTGGPHE